MDWLLSSALMGFAGSLHCIGMCGPLVVSLEMTSGKSQWMRSRWVYHLGRLTSYTLLGAAFGMLGLGIAQLGFQRWLVLLSGGWMLLLLIRPPQAGRWKFLAWQDRVRRAFLIRMKDNHLGARFVMGALNGLLPCGLVYVALAASLATMEGWKGAAFMAVFGLATSPALFFVSVISKMLSARFRNNSFRWVQIGLVTMSFLIILRGANLGIPFLSPSLNPSTENVCCHTVHHK